MFDQNGRETTAQTGKDPLPDNYSISSVAQRQEVVQTIDSYTEKLEECRLDRYCITNRLKLMQMKTRAFSGDSLAAIERDLWTMAADIENPSLRIQRNVILVTILYTLFAVAAFSLITLTDAILVPSFNIPYSILLMGLLGCLSSMYIILPNFRAGNPVDDTSTLMFIIKPPIAIVMAGIVFGLIQILLPIIEMLLPFNQIYLPDESWLYWVLAWCAGFVNWANLDFKINFRKKFGRSRADATQSGQAENVQSPVVTNGVQIDDIISYVQSKYEGIVIDYNWGDRGVFYNPDNRLPRGIHIMTFKVNDSRHDKVSNLERKGAYRLSMSISKETFIQMFGSTPPKPATGGTADTGHDYRQLDLITPHPKFGWMAWISVLSPGQTTLETLKPLIEESCDQAKLKYEKKLKTARWSSSQLSLDEVSVN